MGLTIAEYPRLVGRIGLVLRDADSGRVVHESMDENLITTAGLNILAPAINWALIQNYNTSWGSPFSSSQGNLGNVYGALGNSLTTPLAGDTVLGFEVGRSQVTSATGTAPTLTFSFFFGTTQANATLNEAGVFVQATQTATALTTGLTAFQTYTSIAVGALSAAIPNGATMIVGYGNAVTTQLVVLSAPAALGATSISVTSFIANASYAIGAAVVYNTGTLFDHALVTSPPTKTNAQTATLSLNLTLQSG